MFRASVVLCIVAIACAGGKDAGEMATAQPASGVVRTVVADRDVRMLLVDLTAERVCDHLAGEYLGLSASDEQKKPTQAETQRDPAKKRRGRLLIESCDSKRTEGDQVEIELTGRGWRHVDKRSEKLGATFEVSHYVRFAAELGATGTVDLAYARNKHVLTLMLTPTEPIRARVRPLGGVDAEANGPWAGLLGAASSVIGKSPDREASKKFAEQGSQGFATKLATGYTVAIDLCSGQKHETIGELPVGGIPDVARDPRGRRFEDNERVELMPGGIDLAGPYRKERMPIEVEIASEAGDGVIAELICSSDALRVANAFISGKRPPEVHALAKDTVASGKLQTLRVKDASCDVVLYTRPAGKQAMLSYLAYSLGEMRRALVPCERP